MAAPDIHLELIQPPHPKDYPNDDAYRFQNAMWMRSGGLTSWTPNLKGLTASVSELNTLVGITTSTTVQAQLNLKANSSDLGTMSTQNKNAVNITGGSISGVSIDDSDINNKAGASTTIAELGGTINVNTTVVGNSGAVETNLISYSLPANSLNANNDYYEIVCWGILAANANNKQVRLKYGASTIYDTTLLAANSGDWMMRTQIVRLTSNSQTCATSFITSNATFTNQTQIVASAEDNTVVSILKCTGLAVADNDIQQLGLIVKWFKS